MDITINDKQFNIPSDVAQIPLYKFIEWYNRFGQTLDKTLTDNYANADFDYDLHIDREALSWYSFWTGYDFFTMQTVELTDLLLQYRILKGLLRQSENKTKDFPASIEWDGVQWAIQDYRIVPGHLMSFNELLTGKEVVRQIESLSKSKWDALPYLCCIYLRKPDEAYNEKMIDTDGERFKLMQSLPLDIALQVGFFLNNSINSYYKHLASLLETEARTRQWKL